MPLLLPLRLNLWENFAGAFGAFGGDAQDWQDFLRQRVALNAEKRELVKKQKKLQTQARRLDKKYEQAERKNLHIEGILLRKIEVHDELQAVEVDIWRIDNQLQEVIERLEIQKEEDDIEALLLT